MLREEEGQPSMLPDQPMDQAAPSPLHPWLFAGTCLRLRDRCHMLSAASPAEDWLPALLCETK